jgi:tetratricopeptide (TPR) repeat protein
LVIFAIAFAWAVVFEPAARAGEITVPPEARQAMDYIYTGNLGAAEPIAHALEEEQPDHPLGFLLEAEAQWWRIYCAACQIKWGMVDDWGHGKKPSHDAYLALADQVVHLAKAQLEKSDTAEMHVYAGLGWALKARVYDERDDHRNVARSGVAARAEFLRALQIDPDTPDATAGVGLYNYYVDTLSPVVKVLRFFMGIPGGNKQEGIRQMQQGMEHGVLFNVDTRYYLAKNLRTFDLRYQQALDVAQPLAEKYPRNATFLLLAGNLHMELGHSEKAADYFHSALGASSKDAACADRIRDLATEFLASLPPPSKTF